MIYLAGPIAGLDYSGAVDWREQVAAALAPLETFSPMRGKHFLSGVKSFASDPDNKIAPERLNPMSSQRGIMGRDHWDVCRAQAIFANFLGAKAPSIGTSMELAWAYHLHRPVIAVIEASGNPHEHGMLKETFTYRVASLGEGVHLAKVLFGCGADGGNGG